MELPWQVPERSGFERDLERLSLLHRVSFAPFSAARSSIRRYVPAVTVVLAISPTVVVLLVTWATTCAKSLSQLCLATSNRSARFLGSATRILRSRSRACGVTYSGNVRGVVVMYLYS